MTQLEKMLIAADWSSTGPGDADRSVVPASAADRCSETSAESPDHLWEQAGRVRPREEAGWGAASSFQLVQMKPRAVLSQNQADCCGSRLHTSASI